MKIALKGKKIGMTRVFQEDGKAVVVSVVEMEPSVVTQVKSSATDGYSALRLGHGTVKEKKLNKAQKTFFEKSKIELKKNLYELRLEKDIDGVAVGDYVGIDNFEVGDFVDVTAVSIGKGFQGVVKRHHFGGGLETHGDTTGRCTGSIGQSAYPSRVLKNMRGPGQMGNEQVTVQNLEVIKVDVENNLLVVKGGIPGPKNSLVRVNGSLKRGTDRDIKVTKSKKQALKTDETATSVNEENAASEEPKTEE
jgi:large subunit ribosomal protein L3